MQSDPAKSKTLGKEEREAGRQRLLFPGIILGEESKGVNMGGKHGVKGEFYFVQWEIL